MHPETALSPWDDCLCNSIKSHKHCAYTAILLKYTCSAIHHLAQKLRQRHSRSTALQISSCLARRLGRAANHLQASRKIRVQCTYRSHRRAVHGPARYSWWSNRHRRVQAHSTRQGGSSCAIRSDCNSTGISAPICLPSGCALLQY